MGDIQLLDNDRILFIKVEWYHSYNETMVTRLSVEGKWRGLWRDYWRVNPGLWNQPYMYHLFVS